MIRLGILPPPATSRDDLVRIASKSPGGEIFYLTNIFLTCQCYVKVEPLQVNYFTGLKLRFLICSAFGEVDWVGYQGGVSGCGDPALYGQTPVETTMERLGIASDDKDDLHRITALMFMP